jgi:ADP-L-glycero-D-manno-heptose 6-epimerase
MIVVTGAAGFIGYRIARAFQERGERVIAVDALEAFATRPEHRDLKPHLCVAPHVILDRSFYTALKLAGTPVKAIFHLGASSDTTELRVDFLKRVNIDYSKTLWDFAVEFEFQFLYASSAATYGAGELGYEDNEAQMHLLKPLNPYGESKKQFDLIALEEERRGHAPRAWSGYKFFNVYGFGERHKTRQSSVVLQGFDQIRSQGFIRLFKSHKPGFADGEQKRDFVWVDDVVDVMLWAYDSRLSRGIYNLGSGTARSFKDLALATFSALKKEPDIRYVDTPVEIRDRYQYFTEAPMQKLKSAGYSKPMTPLEVGVQKTVESLLGDTHEDSSAG